MLRAGVCTFVEAGKLSTCLLMRFELLHLHLLHDVHVLHACCVSVFRAKGKTQTGMSVFTPTLTGDAKAFFPHKKKKKKKSNEKNSDLTGLS
jgi:hypothetical protein